MWWTTEQVAEHAGMTVEQVYVTRRQKEWPGVVGVRQGRSLRFDPELVKAGPREPEHTDDAATAAVWLLEDLRDIARDIRQAVEDIRTWQREQRPVMFTVHNPTYKSVEESLADAQAAVDAIDDDEERADDDSDE